MSAWTDDELRRILQGPGRSDKEAGDATAGAS